MLSFLRRLPLVFILVVGVCALFMVVSYDHQRRESVDAYNRLLYNRELAIDGYLKIGEKLGQKKLWDDLYTVLEEARQAKRIDFYILQHRGRALWFGEKNANLDRVDIPYPVTDQLFVSPEVSLRSIMIGPDDQLTVGLDHDLAGFEADQTVRRNKVLFDELIYVLVIITIVGVYSLRDITLMVRELKRGRRGHVAKVKTRSAESELFLKGLSGYSKAVADLEAENIRLGRQVLPSLQKEIHSGRQPPYDFECTMVRTDINGFSTIFNTQNVTEFMATINEFFDEVSRIVARYGGLIHEFVGDEVIFYFKDEDHENSFLVALSALRDINSYATKIHRATMESRGYPFTVKSSLAHGRVRFGPLVGGFTIAGAVLIETVRILGFISEKDENAVYFDGIHQRRLGGVVTSHERMQVKMKGYQSEITLHQYVAHRDLADVLSALSEATDLLLYYRSDSDLVAIIEDLKKTARDEKTVLSAIRALREAHVARPTESVTPHLREWIGTLRTQANSEKVLSAVVMLYLNLVPAGEFDRDDADLLRSLLSFADRRVVANVIEVLTHFGAETKQSFKSVRHDVRIQANSLVHAGRDELTGPVVKRIGTLMKSKNNGEVASALYALGELALVHRRRDFAYYSAQIEFQNLISQLPVFAQHPATMIRRQALIAARKAEDDDVNMKIRHHVRDSGSELLAEELLRYLDTGKSSAA